QQLAVELVGVHALQSRCAAPLPMLDEITEELAAPADSAFEESETQLREAPGDATEEDALGDRVAGRREMANMVVDEVARRVAQPLAAGTAVEGRSDLQLGALRPYRVVVVRTVDAQHVVPHGEAGRLGILARSRSHLARHAAAEHADLGAELLGDELELGDRLLRRMHRNDRRRRHAVLETTEIIGRDYVVGANDGAPRLIVLDAR